MKNLFIGIGVFCVSQILTAYIVIQVVKYEINQIKNSTVEKVDSTKEKIKNLNPFKKD